MDATNRAFVVHLTPPRIRIKIPQRERQDAYFATVQRALERHSGVVFVRVNPLVGSVVIHCLDGFAIASVGHCFAGLELVLPPCGSAARHNVRAQRFHNGSEGSIRLASLIVKLTIAIATRQFEALIRELILEAAVQPLVQQLYRKAMQSLPLEAPRARLVAAAG